MTYASATGHRRSTGQGGRIRAIPLELNNWLAGGGIGSGTLFRWVTAQTGFLPDYGATRKLAQSGEGGEPVHRDWPGLREEETDQGYYDAAEGVEDGGFAGWHRGTGYRASDEAAERDQDRQVECRTGAEAWRVFQSSD